MKTTEILSPFAKVVRCVKVAGYGVFAASLLGLMGTACYVSSDPSMIQRGLDAQVVAMVSDPSQPTTKYALEGYKDSCVFEVWNYPSQYSGIQEWKDAEPNKAKATHIEKAENPAVCDKNFNPDNPAVPFSGRDYGQDFGLRPEHNVVEIAA